MARGPEALEGGRAGGEGAAGSAGHGDCVQDRDTSGSYLTAARLSAGQQQIGHVHAWALDADFREVILRRRFRG